MTFLNVIGVLEPLRHAQLNVRHIIRPFLLLKGSDLRDNLQACV